MPSSHAARLKKRQYWRQQPYGWLLSAILIGSFLVVGGASEAQQEPKSTVQSKIVTVYATVRDKHGKIVSNLKKENFVLDEDGRAQTISYLARESDLPLTLGLLVDTSRSQRDVLDGERKASYVFLDQMLHEDKDRAFLIHFDNEVELLQDLTSLREKLQSALALLQISDQGQTDEEGSPDEHRDGGAALYDGIYLASNELMKKQEGRKAIVVLTGGVDHGSKESLEDAIESAQRADTVVYSILFGAEETNEHAGRHSGWGAEGGGMGWPGGGGGGGWGGGGGGRTRPYSHDEKDNAKRVLGRISTETGGRLFLVSKKLTVDQIYAQIEEDLRNQYILGYVPDISNAAAGYRKINLTVNQKDLEVQARDGYYSGQ
ncbi:MAG: VWA domain-containing protein [Candidatus Acidiferrales bacterium]